MNAFRSTVFLLPAMTMALVAACNRTDKDSSSASTGALTSTSPTTTTSTSPVPAMVEGDRTFMMKAAGGGLYEVEISKFAAQQASNPQVKVFAAMLVDHHTVANGQLMSLATLRGVALPDTSPPEKRAVIAKLKALSGEALDRQFVKQVGIDDHQSDIQLFEAASASSTDPDLKAWASQTLPTLRDHLAAAQKLPM